MHGKVFILKFDSIIWGWVINLGFHMKLSLENIRFSELIFSNEEFIVKTEGWIKYVYFYVFFSKISSVVMGLWNLEMFTYTKMSHQKPYMGEQLSPLSQLLGMVIPSTLTCSITQHLHPHITYHMPFLFWTPFLTCPQEL